MGLTINDAVRRNRRSLRSTLLPNIVMTSYLVILKLCSKLYAPSFVVLFDHAPTTEACILVGVVHLTMERVCLPFVAQLHVPCPEVGQFVEKVRSSPNKLL